MKFRKSAYAIALSLMLSGTAMSVTTMQSATLGTESADLGDDIVLGHAFVTDHDSSTISIVNLDQGSVTAKFAYGENPGRLVVDAAHHRVYVAHNITLGMLSVMDANSGALLDEILVGREPVDIAADFQRGEVYVVNRGSDSLAIIDTSTNEVVAKLPAGHAPGNVTVNPRLHKIYVTSASDNAVRIFDQTRHTLIRVLHVGINPGNATVDLRTGKVYVHNIADKTVSIIDPATDTVGKVVRLGSSGSYPTDDLPGHYPRTAIAVTSGATSAIFHRYYLPVPFEDMVSIIDTDLDQEVANIQSGAGPQSVVVDEDGGNVYVANLGSEDVSVVDARMDRITATIAIGGAPWRLRLAAGKLLALNHGGPLPDTLVMASQKSTLADTAIATEYFHAGFGHFFHTADAVENRVINDGLYGEAWKQTMEFFRVWTGPGGNRQPVCRLLSTGFGEHSSHFFTANVAECEQRRTSSDWTYEGASYYLALPDANGACADGTAALFRLFNDGQGGTPNHRYTTSRATRDAMVASGWIAEGSGPEVVYACTPTLRGD